MFLGLRNALDLRFPLACFDETKARTRECNICAGLHRWMRGDETHRTRRYLEKTFEAGLYDRGVLLWSSSKTEEVSYEPVIFGVQRALTSKRQILLDK